uniref:Uncharacterized protein n=1 Tax=Anguilla anguilla TaxID=7936 RepID=A0A0E9SAQ7_ANGAN
MENVVAANLKIQKAYLYICPVICK